MLRDDCLFCRRFEGKEADPGGALLETGQVRAQHAAPEGGAAEVHEGWLIVTPLRHVTSLAELTTEESDGMGIARTRLAEALLGAGAQHVYSMVIGDRVPHVHEHVIARWPDTPKEHFGPTKLLAWQGARHLDAEGLRSFCEALRAGLRGTR
jgi:histidine triad (HIT) family protein